MNNPITILNRRGILALKENLTDLSEGELSDTAMFLREKGGRSPSAQVRAAISEDKKTLSMEDYEKLIAVLKIDDFYVKNLLVRAYENAAAEQCRSL